MKSLIHYGKFAIFFRHFAISLFAISLFAFRYFAFRYFAFRFSLFAFRYLSIFAGISS